MQGQGSASGPLPEALEFEGRFMSSHPITNNQFWWHHEQNPLEQQLPDFIPIPNDTGASHHGSVAQAAWNTERLNLGQSSSSSIKNGSGYSEQLMDLGRASSANAYAVTGSGSNNLPYHPAMGTYPGNSNETSTYNSNHSIIRPVVAGNSMNEISLRDFLTNAAPSDQVSTNHIATAGASACPSINFYRTGFREGNNDGPGSAVVTSHSSLSDKRKSPEGSWDESSARASKRSVHIAGSSGVHAAPSNHTPVRDLNISSSSANMFVLGSSGTLASGTVHPPRSSLVDSPESGTARSDRNGQPSSLLMTNNSMQDSMPQNFTLSGTGVRHNSHLVGERPRLVLPPPQAAGQGLNVQNHLMPVHCPVTPQNTVHFARHLNGSRNSSATVFAAGTSQVEDIGLRNVTQSLQLPVTAPPVSSRNLARSAINFRTSVGDAIISENAVLGVPSDPVPSLPLPVPDLVSTSNRQHRLEQIRQALLDVDYGTGASSNNHPGDYLGITPSLDIGLQPRASSHGTQTLQQRATSLQIPGHNHSNFGAPGHNSTYSYETETRQRFLSRARHILALYRGGRDLQTLEDGVNVRQSLLSALASFHDQHRDMRLDVDNMSYEELLELGERIGDVKTGLSEETIMKCLKHNKYTSVMKPNKPEPCSICQEEYGEGEDLGTLECGHEYHTNCIKQWLVLKNSCPICKAAGSSSK
uniref:RING-type E3 ubiquitin transferase n=2 Tax=Kalanchoe fedtschenkoi TaxID=63787 RepID=A0A7N1A3A0_KALFE